MAGIQASQNPVTSVGDGPRPVNLRTDLGQLADLIEIAFADSMDSNGRSAVREMRQISRMGAGLTLLAGLNNLAQGMGMGYVWIADGRLVGNVSAYPAESALYGSQTWVIVNVAVHPNYQRRGIAEHLMRATMDMILSRGGREAILQVDADNAVARRLYNRLGFVDERTWITWRRGVHYPPPSPLKHDPPIFITQRRPDEWRAEYALAEIVRPPLAGGVGWMRPLHPNLFRKTFWKRVGDWLNFRSNERLIIRDPEGQHILASLWIDNSLGSSAAQLTLLVHPDYEGLYDEALLNTVARRFGTHPLSIEHPADCAATTALLRRYHFTPRREVVHMRWDIE